MTPSKVADLMHDPESWIALLTTLKEEHEGRVTLQEQLQDAAPKIQFANAVAGSDDCILIRSLAQFLQSNGVKIGQNRSFERLR